jgi:hypothetical protein
MNRILHFAISMGLVTACRAQAMGSLADVAVIDRDSGAVLSPHYYRGEYWVAGTPGARYSIEIRNCMGERLLAVTAVDGVNVVSGASAAWDQTGYVFSPGEQYQITGWRKTDTEVAAFTFTASGNSYAARTGRPANVGVIGVALFRERPPQPVYDPPMIGRDPPTDRLDAPRSKANGSAALDARVAPAAPSVTPQPVPVPKLGTGHGEREYSLVSRTDFMRMQSQPNEVIRIRYDSMDNLLAMGIIKRPRPAAPTLNPFPASPEPQYVPDPRG